MHSNVNYFLSVEGGKLLGNKLCSADFSMHFMTVCEEVKMLGIVSYQGSHSLLFSGSCH